MRKRANEAMKKAAAEADVILKIIQWILRLLAWPWAARGSLERWPAAPRMTAGNTRRQSG